jgi:hypothetical protein
MTGVNPEAGGDSANSHNAYAQITAQIITVRSGFPHAAPNHQEEIDLAWI